VAERHQLDYAQTPNSVRYTRQRLAYVLPRALQQNAQHLYGTRVRQLVADFDRNELIPNAFDAAVGGTSPEYYVRLSRGATRLFGTICWTADIWFDNATQVEAQFFSERGGAGVASGLDPANSDILLDSAARVDPQAGRGNPRRQWDMQRGMFTPEPENPVLEDQYGERVHAPRWMGGETVAIAAFAQWAPDLTTTHDQRIMCRTRNTVVAGNAILLGVMVWEEVPQA